MTNQNNSDSEWRLSDYNLYAANPDKTKIICVNLMEGTCGEFSPAEIALIKEVVHFPDDHPLIHHYAESGIIVNHDEKEELRNRMRKAVQCADTITLTILPTRACNFRCPYCFEVHDAGCMSKEVQQGVLHLTKRMLEESHAEKLHVTWFGGEPLLGISIIETLSQELIRIAEAYRAEYSADIVTNGYLLNPQTVKILNEAKIDNMQITLDGMQEQHDSTRHLADGTGTFDVITGNLRTLKLPFPVDIRHNIHEGNSLEAEKLKTYVKELGQESGNDLRFYTAAVHDSDVSKERGSEVTLVCSTERKQIELQSGVRRFTASDGIYCGAQNQWTLLIDEAGLLYRCWEMPGILEESFGSVFTFDPADMFHTAERPSVLETYLNPEAVFDDPECADCVFLPGCCGGCPMRRFHGEKSCTAYRDDPEAFVLAVYRHWKEQKKKADNT